MVLKDRIVLAGYRAASQMLQTAREREGPLLVQHSIEQGGYY